jgi:uncharacterized protein (DUF2249 family)
MVLEFKELDVRPLLEAGAEPFREIMSMVDALGPDEGLRLLAPFEPKPLFTVMERKGYGHEVSELEGGDFEVRFFPKNVEIRASGAAAGADVWPEPAIELDLTDLDPPQPMVKILNTLEAMPAGAVLFALLGREPVFLFPELTKRGHQWVGNYDKLRTAFRIMIKRGASEL